MNLEGQMTNEVIKKRFINNFDLVNHAITIAKKHLSEKEELPSLADLLKEMCDSEKIETDK